MNANAAPISFERPFLADEYRRSEARVEIRGGFYQVAVGALVVLAVAYNGLLAMMGAHGAGISMGMVMIVEALILAIALVLVARVPFGPDDAPSIALLLSFLFITLYISAMKETFYPDSMRNIAIIGLFTMLGVRASFQTVNRTFLVSAVIVLAGLILEMISTPAYVSMFQPAQYFLKTRGLAIPEWDTSGLFTNALGFEERFSFGITDHRTSSIFLEQVSNSNFAAVLNIYLLSVWKRLKVWHRVFFIFTAVLIVTTASTRTSLVLALLAPAGYFIYPHLTRFLNIALAPLFITIAWVVGDHTLTKLMDDDFVGRLSWTISALYQVDWDAAVGLRTEHAPWLLDSGYTWIIYTCTIFGLFILWTFMACYVPQKTVSQRRFGYAASLFCASSLLVAGQALFSIKIAALLWFLAGFMRAQKEEWKAPPPPDSAEAKALAEQEAIDIEAQKDAPAQPQVIRLLRTR